MAALRDDAQRTAVLSRLRPTQTAAAAALFPNYTLSSESALLPFPALGKSVPLGIPDKTVKEPPRRINPFASLFGSSSAPVSLSPSPGPARNLAPESGSPNSGNVSQLSSPHPSIRSLEPDTSSPDPAEGYTVTAYTIDKPVRYNEVYKELVKAVRSSVRHDLDGMPDKVVDKTLKLVVSSVCPVSGVNAADQALLKSHHQVMGSETSSTVPLDFSDPTTTGERVQDFMEAIYDDLVIHYRTADSPRKSWTRSNSAETSEEEDSDKKAQQREEHVEQLASEGTERVEALVCRLLYNRYVLH